MQQHMIFNCIFCKHYFDFFNMSLELLHVNSYFLHFCSNYFWNTASYKEIILFFKSSLSSTPPLANEEKHQIVKQTIIRCKAQKDRNGCSLIQAGQLEAFLLLTITNTMSASRGHVRNISAHLTYQIYLFGKI